jgi:molybdate transport system ATP-binding protein
MPFIKKLRDQYQIPIVYVTHSQEEIFAVADGVVVMEAGRVKSSGNLDLLRGDK